MRPEGHTITATVGAAGSVTPRGGPGGAGHAREAGEVERIYARWWVRRGGYGAGPANTRGRLPDQPTRAAPLSEAKIAVMQERASRGETLFHPKDAK